MRLFVYGTLRAAGIQDEAMGREAETTEKAFAFGYRERFLEFDGVQYPTIIRDDKRDAVVAGDIIEVDNADLRKLDAWEDHYVRIQIKTRPSGEAAWTYVLNPPNLPRKAQR